MPIFSDGFAGTTGNALSAHTPDSAGASWYILFQASAELITQASELRAGATGVGKGQTCGAADAPIVNDHEIEITLTNADTSTATRRVRLHGRLTTIGDYYTTEFLPPGHASNDCTIYKKVGGTKTSLATVDTGLAASDLLTFRITNENKVLYKGGTCIISTNDNAISALGLAAVSMGLVDSNDGGNVQTIWRFDNFLVRELDTISRSSNMLNVYRM